ncbi:hypothetical protein ABIC03_004140 [Bradyrhizobium sp. RT6a]|jgi:hypothetical protein
MIFSENRCTLFRIMPQAAKPRLLPHKQLHPLDHARARSSAGNGALQNVPE